MSRQRVAAWLLVSFVLLTATEHRVAAQNADVARVFSEDRPLEDPRLDPPRDIYDAYHPWAPPTRLPAWQQAARQIREQVLVAAGLWPLPEKMPLQAVVHGAIERDGYIVEKVYFASMPGQYVAGNLYRPAKVDGRVPGILCPHGHWDKGRFYDAGDGAQAQIDSGAESFASGAHSPLQARFVQLARMGCIVFHYDMLGYADSRSLDHRSGMDDVRSLLWQNNKLGLQTWNSIRALDFLLSLPDVDPDRLACTGASGGGTQTMLLGAVDDRLAVSFPAVMVSTGMQGGCICENAAYLRIGLNNIAFAAAFAPRPQKMSGADDWTIEIETKGLPELKQVYGLFGARDLVDARALPQFKHNFNEPSRELMYNWFNEHLNLGLPGPIEQTDFEPLSAEQLTVFDDEHPQPADALSDSDLQQQMIERSRRQFEQLVASSGANFETYREVIGTAARVMLGEVPAADSITSEVTGEARSGEAQLLKGWGRRETGEVTPWLALVPPDADGRAVLWVHGEGKSHLLNDAGEPADAVQSMLNAGLTVVAIDLFGTGEFPASSLEARNKARLEKYPGFLFCYNRPLLAEQAGDIAAAAVSLAAHPDVTEVHLVGTDGAGAAALLARALVPAGAIGQTIVDLDGASFEKVSEPTDPLLLPAALKYGGLGGLAALALPGPLSIHGIDSEHEAEFDPLRQLAGDGGKVELSTAPLDLSRFTQQLGD
jgi:dienelactone hydrolase